MKTTVLIKVNNIDQISIYDTEMNKIYSVDGKDELNADSLYIIKNNSLICTSDAQEIKDHLQTFRIISD